MLSFDVYALKHSLAGRSIQFCLVLCAGFMLSFSMAPHNLWTISFLSFSVFYVILASSQNIFWAALHGWAFSFGFFIISLSWIGNALLVDGNDYRWAYPLAVVALPFALAFFSAIASTLIFKLSNLRTSFGFMTFVTLLSLFEFLRGHLFTGFPWNLYGYAWSGQIEVLQILSLQNVYVLTMLTIFWASTVGFWVISNRKKQATIITIIAALTLVLAYGYGAWRITKHDNLQTYDELIAHIVQPNIPQFEKWDHEKIGLNFQKHLTWHNQVKNSDKNLYIWPETAIHPQYEASEQIETILEGKLQQQTGTSSALLTGALIYDPETNQYTNSLIEYNENGRSSAQYDKAHLVPFGEYIPFQKWIPLETVTRFSGIKAGKGLKTLTVFETLKYSPLICYEILFPGNVVDPTNRPDFIVNITNDAWYGNSAGPHQHLMKARFRAIEEGISVLRAANTGISAVIDPLGNVIEDKALFQAGVLISKIPKSIDQNRKIFYTGDMLLYVGFLAWMLFFLYKRSRKRKL